MAVFALTPVLPVIAFGVFLLGLFCLCIAHRWAAILLGLTLAITCVIFAIEFLTDPKMGDDAFIGILFLPWAGFGLWLAAGKGSKKRVD